MQKKGFTIVELSIVLLIIGFLAGTIVVGRSMIDSSKATNIIKEYQYYQSAALLFKQTYKELPGDFSNSASVLGTTRNGNGDDVVMCNAGQWEFYDFFQQLSKTGMIDAKLSEVNDSHSNIVRGTTVPATDVIEFGWWSVKNPIYTGDAGGGASYIGLGWGPDFGSNVTIDNNNDNYLVLSRFENGAQAAFGVDVSIAQSVDSKIDDKLPNDGIVRGGGWVMGWHTSQPVNTDCTLTRGVSAPYNTASRFGCVLSFKMRKR